MESVDRKPTWKMSESCIREHREDPAYRRSTKEVRERSRNGKTDFGVGWEQTSGVKEGRNQAQPLDFGKCY